MTVLKVTASYMNYGIISNLLLVWKWKVSLFCPKCVCDLIDFLLTESLKREVNTCRTHPTPQHYNIMWLTVNVCTCQLQGRLTRETCHVHFHAVFEKNACGGFCKCNAQITSSDDMIPTAMRAWLEECPPLVFFPPFHINVSYIHLTHKRQKLSSMKKRMPHCINSQTAETPSTHTQFY